jgi:hypothetical protein
MFFSGRRTAFPDTGVTPGDRGAGREHYRLRLHPDRHAYRGPSEGAGVGVGVGVGVSVGLGVGVGELNRSRRWSWSLCRRRCWSLARSCSRSR